MKQAKLFAKAPVFVSSDDDDSDDETITKKQKEKSKSLQGVTIYIEGAFAGYTHGKLKRLITDAGGKVAKRVDDDNLSHVVISGALWGREGTASASQIIRNIKKANEANATEDDLYADRVWILPIEWLEESLKAKECLKEEDHDFEIQDGNRRAHRAAEIAEENRRYKAIHGRDASQFGRGERKKLETAQRLQANLDAATKEMAAAAAEARNGLDGSAGHSHSEPKKPGDLLLDQARVDRSSVFLSLRDTGGSGGPLKTSFDSHE